jgi:ABC-type sugar transport system ATPase subunit
MTKVDLEHVVKQYDALEDVTLTGYRSPPALNNINLSIHAGETVAIVGPSGCGKSTLLKVVAGLEYPNSGRILYDGHDVTDIKPQARGVGFVFQDYALYPTKKGKGNLQYFFEVHKRSESEQEARIKATAELMGVDFNLLLGQLPDTLSGGQKQRVAIARCIVRDPNIFLMDEPIVNLDAKLRERTRIEIKKLLKQFGITTLYVTHDQQEAIFMGDRICVMRQGVIEQLGTFDDLYYSPANVFVAAFVGTPPMTVLPVTVQARMVHLGNHRWALPDHLAHSFPSGPARLGVRPEGWLLDTHDGATMQIRHIERIPTERAAFLSGVIAGQHAVVLAALDYPETTSVTVAPDWARAYLFAAESEDALYTPGVPELF